ncbi:efflux transporter, outer membrane factor (OMF) lipoprotein, NodT family [Spirosomataceae bacterium TFI 002]|nr:efflux transporter, outer membrane factor (OMF) lipoprotein, NodT family [Spirosomataceae bacterium TFI 002]
MKTRIMKNKIVFVGIIGMSLLLAGCNAPLLTQKSVNRNIPLSFSTTGDTLSTEVVDWKSYFQDPFLNALIDTALSNNQELNITLQEIEIAKNEISARKGEYLPFVGYKAGAGVEKVGRYTSQGANDANTEIKDGKETPEFLPDFVGGLYASWELDIWHKLRNAQKAASMRYLATQEGKNFMVTNLIAEIANSYYELRALDYQLEILESNIEIQSNALRVVKIQKQASKVTELAVKRFEAQVLNTQSMQFRVKQDIVEVENRINFLLGRYPQPVLRNKTGFEQLSTDILQAGLPSQLIENRPDIRMAENELAANKLDVEVAKANFYPSLGLSGVIGLQSFNPVYLANLPKSLLTSLAGDLIGPLVNKRAITTMYLNANAKQTQAIYQYEQTLLNAYLEVSNQLANVENLKQTYDFKSKEVSALNESVSISNSLFNSARADYLEVLLTQKEALASKLELVETKMNQMHAKVNVYKALGGGWK